MANDFHTSPPPNPGKPAKSTPLIQLNDIVKNYKSMRALDHVNLTIPHGITGLLGPNGAGKSTLIKMLLGLVSFTSGSGTILGLRLGADAKAIRDRVGYLPEDDCYIPGMSGIQVVQFSACLAGLPKIEALRRSHEILDFCGMKQERYRTIDTFSTGMRQKIKFASAIVHDPDLLILDEPTSGLDPEERESMLNRVRILNTQAGKSVLICTHILPDVQTTCDNVVIISNGQVKLSQSLNELNQRSSPTFTIKINCEPTDFVSALQSVGFQPTITEIGDIEVIAETDEALSPIWQAATMSNVSIRSVQPAKNSLEEIFIRTIEEAQHAPA